MHWFGDEFINMKIHERESRNTDVTIFGYGNGFKLVQILHTYVMFNHISC